MTDINAIKNGNDVAFENAYKLYHVKLFRFFLKRTRVHDLSRELTQLAFIRLWQYRHTLSEQHTLDTQLFTMAASTLVDHLRRQATENKRQLALAGNAAAEPLEMPADPVFEAMDYVQSLISYLPPVRRKVMLLRIQQGYSNKEIAAELRISVKTVEDHVTKSLRVLRPLVPAILFTILFRG